MQFRVSLALWFTLAATPACLKKTQQVNTSQTAAMEPGSSPAFQQAVCAQTYGFLEREPESPIRAGIYQGSFDPPTRAHLAIVDAAITQYAVDRMFVFANKNGRKDYQAGIGERTEMLKRGLSRHGKKVEVLSVMFECKSFVSNLITRKNRETVSFIGYDSYEVLPREEREGTKKRWVVFPRDGGAPIAPAPNVEVFRGTISEEGVSSSEVRKRLTDRAPVNDLLTPEVEAFVRENHLYQAVPQPWQPLQEQLWRNAVDGFVTSMRRKKVGFQPGAELPPFLATQSGAAWADKLVRWTMENSGVAPERYLDLEQAARFTAYAKFEDLIYIQLPSLRLLTWPPNPAAGSGARTQNVDLTAFDTTGQPYNMDANAYVEDRFPKPLQDYVVSKALPVFIHAGDQEQALGWHAAQGFEQFVQVSSKRGQAHRNLFLAKNSAGQERFVLTSVFGRDRFQHVARQVATMAHLRAATFVEHPASEFVQPTPLGQTHAVGADDILMVGFQNTIVRELERSGRWKAVGPFSQPPIVNNLYHSAAFIDLLVEQGGKGRRLFLCRNVYGDEINRVLEWFYARGVRRIMYMGTAGGISNRARLGTVLVPSRFTTNGTSEFTVENLFKGVLGQIAQTDAKQGWVAAVLEETLPKLQSLRTQGVDGLDIESVHVAEFARAHSDLKFHLALVVSDETLGEVTLEEYADVSAEKVRQAVASFVPQILGAL